DEARCVTSSVDSESSWTSFGTAMKTRPVEAYSGERLRLSITVASVPMSTVMTMNFHRAARMPTNCCRSIDPPRPGVPVGHVDRNPPGVMGLPRDCTTALKTVSESPPTPSRRRSTLPARVQQLGQPRRGDRDRVVAESLDVDRACQHRDVGAGNAEVAE